jgi:hypothetical protein
MEWFRFFLGNGYIEFHQKSQGKTLALSTMKFVVHRFISWQVAPQQSPRPLSPICKINLLSTKFSSISKLSTYSRICNNKM